MLEVQNSKTWMDEFKNSIRSTKELSHFLDNYIDEVDYPIFIPRPFAKKIRSAGANSALWKQFVPNQKENSIWGLDDPIGDEIKSPVAQIVHRYSNRVLLMPTNICPIICRYCFRKNELYSDKELFKSNLKNAFDYIEANSEIHEVILSGGDPLILSDDRLEFIFEKLSSIDHIKDIRIHTRTPIILPKRITFGLLDLINRYSNKFRFFHMVIHTNHASEIDEEVSLVLKLLASSRAEVLSQSVLLKEINDNEDELSNLINKLLDSKVRPYYLHHPDKVKGGEHFYLSIEEGREIYKNLRQKFSGWALPNYVIDSPEGSGKRMLN